MAVTALTFHAVERLQQRRGCVHLLKHLNKIKKWGLPDDGITNHGQFAYVTRGGVIITVMHAKKKYDKNKGQKEVTMSKTIQVLYTPTQEKINVKLGGKIDWEPDCNYETLKCNKTAKEMEEIMQKSLNIKDLSPETYTIEVKTGANNE